MIITTAIASAMADVLGVALDTGTVEIYEGAVPTNPNTAIGAQVLLATLTLPADAFTAAASGVITLNTTSPAVAGVTGTANFARWKNSGGTAIMDVTIGPGLDMTINDQNVVSGNTVEITGLTFTQPTGQ